jgi:DedD protein
MDRALLERMVGAVVLVLIFVLIVPALLDGQQDDGTSQTGSRTTDSGRRTEVIVLNSAEQIPVPDIRQLPESQEAPQASAVMQPKAVAVSNPTKAASKPSKPSKIESGTGKQAPKEGYAIQLGSFASRDNAIKYAGKIREGRFPVFVIQGTAGSASVYRVYVGPEKTRSEANKLAETLAADGHNGMVVDLGGGE